MFDYFSEARLEMVKRQLQARGIKEEKLLESMSSVPRHLFVSPSLAEQAYDDKPLPIGDNQTISQPYIVALMIQEAKLESTDVVLEVGAGCGYAAAVLSLLVKKVYAIEFIPKLASAAKRRLKRLGYSNVVVLQGDGSVGFKEQAPFDAILVAAGAPSVPKSLKEQLAIHGRLILPYGKSDSQELVRVTHIGQNNYQEEKLGAVRFVPLRGKEGWLSTFQ